MLQDLLVQPVQPRHISTCGSNSALKIGSDFGGYDLRLSALRLLYADGMERGCRRRRHGLYFI